GNLKNVQSPAGLATVTSFSASLFNPSKVFDIDISNILCCSNTYGITIYQAAAAQLTSSAYGLWASTIMTPGGDMGAFAFGNLTPAASVPTTGSATFKGFTAGVGGASDGSAEYSLQGNAQIIANFATQRVTTNFTNFSASCYCSSPKAS